jgi:hypothetical protein
MKCSPLFLLAVSAFLAFPAVAQAAWSSDGFPVAWAAEQQIYPVITTDGAGGAIIAWQDGRAGDFKHLRPAHQPERHCDVAAERGRAVYGGQRSGRPADHFRRRRGAIVTWFDFRNGTDNNIYARRVDSTGIPQWTANGVAVVQCRRRPGQRES